MNEVFIVTGCRTPIGSFKKGLSSFSAPQLGALTIKETLKRANCKDLIVDEVIMGQVCQANSGQAPAKQAALLAELPHSVPCTTVNKVCASGMKSIIYGCQSIMCGVNDIVIAGGQESMSNVPFYLPRKDQVYGGFPILDGLVIDGLTDALSGCHMGVHVESIAKSLGIDRNAQDAFAKLSYQRSQQASADGLFDIEIVPVSVENGRAGDTIIKTDEECHRANFDKFPLLKPAFAPDGTITAANASSLSDGAACVLLASGAAVKRHGLMPVAKIVSFADAAVDPANFVLAPEKAIKRLLERTKLEVADIARWEINEAFAVAVLGNLQLLPAINMANTNIHGGAVSLGHPLAMSGARIVLHLALSIKEGEKAVAAICNGGGGASAILLQGC